MLSNDKYQIKTLIADVDVSECVTRPEKAVVCY